MKLFDKIYNVKLMVTFTGKAIKQFKSALRGEKNCGIRIFASCGCCGSPLSINVVKGSEKGDLTIKRNGFRVFIEKTADIMLSGTTIDYVDELGFVVTGMPYGSCCVLGRL